MALDDRIQCAAPSCYITSLRRLTDTIGPQDAEQNIHGQIARGLDHADYSIMRAPKPTLLCCATRDFFDIQGAWDSFRQAKRVYTRLGLPEGVDLVETDEEHGWTAELRSGTARWMRRWLLNTNAPLTGQECVILTDEEAQCTEQGQVLLLDGARSVYDLNAEIEAGYAAGRAALWSGDAAAALARVREIADIRPLDQVPACTVETLGTIDRGGYRIEKQVFVPSEGIVVPALRFVPAQPVGAVCLYAHGGGKQAEAAPGGAIEALVKQGLTVVAVDLPGLGETTSAKDPKGGFSKRFSPTGRSSSWRTSLTGRCWACGPNRCSCSRAPLAGPCRWRAWAKRGRRCCTRRRSNPRCLPRCGSNTASTPGPVLSPPGNIPCSWPIASTGHCASTICRIWWPASAIRSRSFIP